MRRSRTADQAEALAVAFVPTQRAAVSKVHQPGPQFGESGARLTAELGVYLLCFMAAMSAHAAATKFRGGETDLADKLHSLGLVVV